MDRTSFCGCIDGVKEADAHRILHVLKEWLGKDITLKLKLSGVQMNYEDEHTYLYCYSSVAVQQDEFMCEGHFNANTEAARLKLEKLHQLFTEAGITFGVEYVATDAEGNWIGEETTIGGQAS